MKKLKLFYIIFFCVTATYGQNYNYDIKYHRLEFEVDPAIHYINGKITTYFSPTVNNFNEISFDLVDEMIIDSVKYNGAILSTTHYSDTLTVNLPNIIIKGQLDSIFIYYQGDPPTTGFGSFVTSEHNGTPIMWTLSEPFGAKCWWPCKQQLNDKADSIDLLVTVPLGNKVGSNGLIVNIDTIGNNTTIHWKHKYPITAYLIAFAVTNYEEYYDYVYINDTLTIPVLEYVYPEDLSYAQNETPNIIEIMQFFCDSFMIYPFWQEKYGHAQFNRGGGMEHQTMSFIGNFSHFLMAHELAHQWFGNYITCGSWGDIWLNEGFAVYLEGMTAEAGLAPYSWEDWKIDNINSVTSEPDGSVFCDDTTSVSRIFNYRLTYLKGGMILHLLRWEIGDEAFFEGIRNYLHDPKLAYGYANANDLKQHFENTCDCDLTNFFDDWYYGEGFPIYNLLWTQNNDNTLYLTVNQTQSTPGIDYFDLTLPIKFVSTTKDTLLTFENTYSGQQYVFDLDFSVDNIVFDPQNWIITRNTSITKFFESESNLVVSLSPNPVENELTIKFPIETFIKNYSIYDSSGRLIITKVTNTYEQYIYIDTSNIPRGNNFIRIETTNGIITKKIIKN